MDISLARKTLKNHAANPFGGTEADDTDGEDVRVFTSQLVIYLFYY